VIAANFIAVAARMSLVTFLGIYFVREAGIDIAVVGIAYLCENAARGLLAPMFGALSDRHGRRPLLLVSYVATGAVLPCFLLVSGPGSLVLWSLALGIAGAVSIPVSSALLLDLAPPERRQSVLAINYTAISVAYTLAVMPAGYIAQRSYSLLAALSCLGYAVIVLLYSVFRFAPATRRPEKKLTGEILVLAHDPAFLRFAACAFAFPLGMGMVVAASPLFAAANGLGEGYIGLVLGGNSIIVAAFAVLVAARIEAGGPFRWLGGAALLVSAAFCLYALVPDPAAAMLAGTVVFSFAELVFSSAVPAGIAAISPPERRGAYQGGWSLVSSFAMGSALFLSGVLREVSGWKGAWLASAALLAAAGAALFLTRGYFLRVSAARRGVFREASREASH
jgi:MFS family permease